MDNTHAANQAFIATPPSRWLLNSSLDLAELSQPLVFVVELAGDRARIAILASIEDTSSQL